MKNGKEVQVDAVDWIVFWASVVLVVVALCAERSLRRERSRGARHPFVGNRQERVER